MIRSQFCSVSAFDYLVATVLTAVVPIAFAFSIYWFAQWGCDANAWLCLFPLALIGVAPIGAILLPILFRLNRQSRYPLPDGLLVIGVLVAIVSQLAVTGFSLFLFADYMRRIFLYEVLIFPQGLAAGAVTGAVFWCSLFMLNKRRARLHRED